MEVQEIMTAKVITVGQDEPVTAAARLLRRWNLGALPVTDSTGRLRGVLTDRDIVLRCLALDNDPADTRVSEVMSRAVVTARPGDSVQSAAALMAREQLRRLPVAENGRLVGMVTACDLARREKLDAEFAEAMRGISANLVRRLGRSRHPRGDDGFRIAEVSRRSVRRRSALWQDHAVAFWPCPLCRAPPERQGSRCRPAAR